MFYRNFFEISVILLFLFASVTGSCLEYGHSCWGAHGKRSGGTFFRGATDLTNAELSLRTNTNDNHVAGREKNPFENFPDVEQTLDKTDENELETHGKQLDHASKLRRLLRKRRPELLTRRAMRIESAELPDQFNGNQPVAERWRRVPILKMKKYAKHGLPAETNDLEQQAEKKSLSRNEEDDGVYFDYK